MKQKNFVIILFVLVIAGLYRLVPHINNLTPIAAMALCSGLYLKKRAWVFALPVIVLYLSDFALNNTINRIYFENQTGLIFWSSYMSYVYGAFILIVGIGLLLKKSLLEEKIIAGTLFSSLLFFLVTNTGSWAFGTLYPKTGSGLIAALLAGIPFFKWTLLGNMFFIPAMVFFFEKMLSLESKTESELYPDILH